jgi:hypothetical protein
MRTRIRWRGFRIVVSTAAAAVIGAVLLSAQESTQTVETPRAIKELTSEVRSLRVAIERTSDSQLQGQILGLYLSLEQSRITQAATRLDAARRELEAVSGRARELAQQAATLEALVDQETDPVKRRKFEEGLRDTQYEAKKFAAQEQQVRNRETEAYQASQTEEARWTELISKLEQLLKK